MVTGSPAPPLEGDSGTLHVRLLGDLQVRVGGEPLGALRSGRARSLLAFLVLHADVAHARQRLAFEFWPDSSEAQARTNLRNVLHTLRRAHPALEAALQVTTTSLQWQPAEPTVVDVERFVAAAEAATTADPDDADGLLARCSRSPTGPPLAADDWKAQSWRRAIPVTERRLIRPGAIPGDAASEHHNWVSSSARQLPFPSGLGWPVGSTLRSA